MNYTITNNALIIACDDEDRKELADLCPETELQSDAALYDFLEPLTCNGLSWVNPDDIGAMTEAPILTEGDYGFRGHCDGQDHYGSDHTSDDPAPVFYYDRYMLRSPLQDLLETGETRFTRHNMSEAA